MAAPRFAPVSVDRGDRVYESPDHVPSGWTPSRPGEIAGRQPRGERLGYQGPDQGYVLKLANRLRDRVHVTAGESIDDALGGCTAIALRRASIYGRAPISGDIVLALTIWGFLVPDPPAELVSARKVIFEGVHDAAHHYAELRAIVDMIPEATLRMTQSEVESRMRGAWRRLVGA